MSQVSNPLVHLRPEILWLHVTLSARLDAPAVEAWGQRMQAYLKANGLIAAISPARIAVLPRNRLLGPSDRGVVLGWLVAQPEVVFVRIEGRGIAIPSELQNLNPAGDTQ